MKLSDWLSENNETGYSLAKKLGCAQSNMSRYLRGKQGIGKKMALKIEKHTQGKVSRHELLWPEEFEEKNEDGSVQMKMNLLKKGKDEY